MKEKEPDRRTLKTRQAIHEAIFSLMQEKQYSKITIQDIIDRANVGRSTFYSHFDTKDELLLSSVDHLFEMLNKYISSYIEQNADQPRLIPVTEFFEHIKENNRIMKGLLKSDGADLFFDKVQNYWNDKMERYILSKLPEGTEPNIPVSVLANHITSTLVNLLKWWVKNKMSYTPKQMDLYFQELINPCIDSIISGHTRIPTLQDSASGSIKSEIFS